MKCASATDEELLAATATTPECFGEFYRRHERSVLRAFLHRGQDAEVAADLTAETFAVALTVAPRFAPGPTPAVAWLFGIARNVLLASLRRGRVEDATRRRLGMQRLLLDEDLVAAIDRLAAEETLTALDAIEREAIAGRVLDDLSYDELAQRLACSEQVVRQRVSRGLKRLRTAKERGIS